MSEIKEEENLLTTGETVEDEEKALEELLKNQSLVPADAAPVTKEAEIKEDNPLTAGIAPRKEEAPVVVPTPQKEEELSPLEKMKQAKENGGDTKGVVMSNDQITEEGDKVLGDFRHNETRMKEISDSIDELDETIKKRNAVILIKNPSTEQEFVKAMLEIDHVKFDSLGKAYINIIGKDGQPVEPEYIRIREENEDIFDYSTLSKFEQKKQEETGATVTDGTPAEETEKDKTVKILIDKTGFGTDFAFTDEEKSKIRESDTLIVSEVKVLDINAIRAKKSEKSFQDVVREVDTKGSRTTICFPGSGIKAQMKGMSYGEYADVALSMDNVTFDQYYKRLSVIYNKMVNISTGPFESFEDFLKNFAYTDIQMALYGLYVATEKENQSIQLRCGNRSCDKNFDHIFNTRSVLRLDKCADTFLNKMKEIATAPAADYDKIRDNSVVQNSKFLEMPDSKYIVEIGIASAYDFLYNFIPLMDEDTFKEAFGEDYNDLYLENILLLTSVRSVHVPDENGDYIECTGYKDILDAIYNLTPEEAKIIAAYTAKIQSEYEVTFSFGRVVCPHCGNVTEDMEVNMDDLVFQTYQRLMSTEVDLKNIADF